MRYHRVTKETSPALNSLKERAELGAEPAEGDLPIYPREQWVERLRSAFEAESDKGIVPRRFRSSAA